jgi:hypothetical protein
VVEDAPGYLEGACVVCFDWLTRVAAEEAGVSAVAIDERISFARGQILDQFVYGLLDTWYVVAGQDISQFRGVSLGSVFYGYLLANHCPRSDRPKPSGRTSGKRATSTACSRRWPRRDRCHWTGLVRRAARSSRRHCFPTRRALHRAVWLDNSFGSWPGWPAWADPPREVVPASC